MAERIDEVERDMISSLEPEELRSCFPGLFPGCICHLDDKASPVVESAFSDLTSYTDDRYWDGGV